RDMSPTGCEGLVNFRITAYRRDFQAHAELTGKMPRKLIFRPFGTVAGAVVKRQWPVAGHDAEFTEKFDLLHQARHGRVGAQQPDRGYRECRLCPCNECFPTTELTHGINNGSPVRPY